MARNEAKFRRAGVGLALPVGVSLKTGRISDPSKEDRSPLASVMLAKYAGESRQTDGDSMWHTPTGDRVLKGAEAGLVRASLRSLLRIINDGPDDFEHSPMFGVPPFDELEQAQRLVLLAQIAAAIFQEDVPPMRLTAVVEATVCALYVNIMNEIEAELEQQFESHGEVASRRWRRLVATAVFETELGDSWPDPDDVMRYMAASPQPDCVDLTEWQREVSGLCDLVCGDRDWQMADDLLDQPPEVAERLKAHLGIDDDYFTAVVPLPKVPELLRARRSLRDLVRARPK